MKPLISEVLHLAADKYLAVDHHDENGVKHYDNEGIPYYKERFSCCAVDAAINELTQDMSYLNHCKFQQQVSDGLYNMGCNVDSTNLFNNLEESFKGYNYAYKASKASQEARYFWLKWAALMAEEQGV